MNYLLYLESKILVIKSLSSISQLPLVERGNLPYAEEGALGTGSTECSAQHSLVLLEKSSASGSGRVAPRRPLYPPVSVVVGAPPLPGRASAAWTLTELIRGQPG